MGTKKTHKAKTNITKKYNQRKAQLEPPTGPFCPRKTGGSQTPLGMHEVKLGQKLFTLPEKWEEITESQFRKVFPLILIDTSKEAQVMAFRQLLTGKNYTYRPSQIEKSLRKTDPLAMVKAAQITTSWLWDAPKVKQGQTLLPIRPIIDSFSHKGTTYHLPQANLADITLDEWIAMDSFLVKLGNTQGETQVKWLNYLVASICRPSKSEKAKTALDYDGFPRVPFNIELVPQLAEKMADVPPHVQHAVVDYARRALMWLNEKYKPLFAGGKGDGFGWHGLVLGCAESGTFGTETEVRKTLLLRVCMYALRKKMDADDFENKMKNLTP